MIPHWLYGARVLFGAPEPADPRQRKASLLLHEMAAAAVAGHHCGLVDLLSVSGCDFFDESLSRQPEDEAATRARFEAACLSAGDRTLHRRGVEEMEAMARRLEALAGNARRKGAICRFGLGLVQRYLTSSLMDADQDDGACFSEEKETGQVRLLSGANFRMLADRLAHYIRSRPDMEGDGRLFADEYLRIAREGEGVYELHMPTGCDPVLPAMLYALTSAARAGLEHVYYVSPRRALLEQSARTLEAALAGNSGDGWIAEHYGDIGGMEATLPFARRWDAPVVFAPLEQLLHTLFGPAAADIRRFHSLARSVILLDGPQSLPAECVHMLNTALNFLAHIGHCQVALCTATPMALRQVEIPIHSLAGSTRTEESRTRWARLMDATHSPPWDAQRLASFLLESETDCLAVVNTMAMAGAVCRLLRKRRAADNEAAIFCMTEVLCPEHRSARLQALRKALARSRAGIGPRVMCVGTAVMEGAQGMVFPRAVRALTGLDHIAQTAACCGNGAKQGEITLVRLRENPAMLPPGCERGQQATLSLLAQWGDKALSPDGVRRYYRKYYGGTAFRRTLDYPVGPEEVPGLEEPGTLYDLLSFNTPGQEASRARGRPAGCSMSQAFAAAGRAFGMRQPQGRCLIVPYGAQGQILAEKLFATEQPEDAIRLMHQAQRYLLPVTSRVWERLMAQGPCERIRLPERRCWMQPTMTGRTAF